MKIGIPDDYQDAVRTLDCFQKLNGHQVSISREHVSDPEALAARLQGAEALVLIRERTPITASLLALLPDLRFIVQTGKRAPHIDLAACTRHGVAVVYATPTVSRKPYATAELAWGREGSRTRAHADGIEVAASKDALFRDADVLSLHLALVEETRGIVSARDLAQMKASALLVNTSRAALIEPGALEEALRAGRPGYAAVDVYENEPVADHPLLHMDNVVCTPHLGYVEKDSYESLFGAAFDQLLAFAAGNRMNVANPVALKQA